LSFLLICGVEKYIVNCHWIANYWEILIWILIMFFKIFLLRIENEVSFGLSLQFFSPMIFLFAFGNKMPLKRVWLKTKCPFHQLMQQLENCLFIYFSKWDNYKIIICCNRYDSVYFFGRGAKVTSCYICASLLIIYPSHQHPLWSHLHLISPTTQGVMSLAKENW